MAFQIQGVSAVVGEVESATRALRVVPRADDYGSLGIYSFAIASGLMAASLAANSPIFTFRNSTANVHVVKRIFFSAGASATAFAAGVATFNGFIARSFTADDTGGTAATLTTDKQKLRTAMATCGANIRYSTTATLTAGTRTKDAQAFNSFTGPVPATAGTPFLVNPVPFLDIRAGEFPLVLAQNEGFTLEATVPITGTWTWSVHVVWEELSSY